MYIIRYKDEDIIAYWTTRVDDTDNYSLMYNDATLFHNRVNAICLMGTLELFDGHHDVIELPSRKEE